MEGRDGLVECIKVSVNDKRYTGTVDVHGTDLCWKVVSYSTGQEMPCLQFRPFAENQPLGRALKKRCIQLTLLRRIPIRSLFISVSCRCLGDLRTQENYSPSFSWRLPENFCGWRRGKAADSVQVLPGLRRNRVTQIQLYVNASENKFKLQAFSHCVPEAWTLFVSSCHLESSILSVTTMWNYFYCLPNTIKVWKQ